MSYCLNPACPNPNNPTHTELCQACGAKLLLRDRYRSTQSLGRGGFGATFLAADEALPGRPTCVIKQLRPAASAPHVLQMARELFEREATILGKIGNHPQIPRLLDYFELNQEFYLVQEHVSGLTLQQEVKRSGALDEPGVRMVLGEVLPILDYIHTQAVIHRDIKPANLIRRSIDNKFVLIDFGAVKDQVSQTVIANSTDDSPFTTFAVGTPGYAPPEQMAMRPVYASDIYALGVTCVYLLTGKSPKDLGFDSETGDLRWQGRVNISDRFANVLKKMLEVSLRHRYQSAKEILRTLDLEPHLGSLSQGMVTYPRGGGTSDQPPSTGANSPAARAAIAVRAQQARREAINGSQTHSLRRTPGSVGDAPSTPLTSVTKGKGKLSANGLQTAYSKGRRDFTLQDLSSLKLQKINLPDAIFNQANLQKTDLHGANLFNVNFGRASLAGSSLRDANLSKAYLSYADLEGADLRGADLSHAYLNNANLRGTNLCGANLTGATISPEQLAMARTNWATVLPTGKKGWW